MNSYSLLGLTYEEFAKKYDFPKNTFQVLRWSCNAGKHLNGGICPHQEKKI